MSNSSRNRKCGLFTLVALFLMGSFSPRVPAGDYRSPADGIQSMEVSDGRLSLEAQDASLDKVLSELSKMAMITIIADGPIEGRLTLHADHLPLEKALRKILRGKDTSFVYAAKAETSPTEYEIREVRIYLSSGDKGESRRYSFPGGTHNRDESRESRQPPRGDLRPRRRGLGPLPPTASAGVPDMATSEEAQKLISQLAEGNLDGLDEIAEKLKETNPQVQEQIDEFLDSLEENRRGAVAGGVPFPSTNQLGDMQKLMKQVLKKSRMSSGQERR